MSLDPATTPAEAFTVALAIMLILSAITILPIAIRYKLTGMTDCRRSTLYNIAIFASSTFGFLATTLLAPKHIIAAVVGGYGLWAFAIIAKWART